MSATMCSACDNKRPVAQAQPAAPVQRSAAMPAASASLAPVAAPRAGISVAERQVRDKEMAAKRQKKEEEKALTLRQAEADRRARLEMQGDPTVRASAVAAEAAAAQASKPAAAECKTVRLQIRCPHWSRQMVLTCFAPDSSLGDVRKHIREELIQGVADTQRARVPSEDAFVLVETVPPRRRFHGTDDMVRTLREIGLVPSGTLIVEAQPIEVEEPVPADIADGGSHVPARDAGTSQADDDSQDDDDNDSDDPADFYGLPPSLGGKAPPGAGRGTGSGSFAQRGPGNMPMPGGNSRASGRKGGPLRNDEPHFPEGGGQVLGSASDSTTGSVALGGAALVSAAAAGNVPPADADAGRAARLAALERRLGGNPASASADSSSSSRGVQLLHQEAGRVSGQMGGSVDKASRNKEREDILLRMQEDREDYKVRRGVNPADIAAASESAEKAAAGSVRLQIRCSSSGRSIVSFAFGASSPLQDVYDFAVKELAGDNASPSGLTLGYPPWTDFSKTLDKSIGDLGLAPAAALLLKVVKVDEPEIDSATGEEGAAASTTDQTAAVVAEMTDDAVVEYQCPRGHVMTTFKAGDEAWCDMCGATLPEGAHPVYECKTCDYVQCKNCCK